MPDREPNESAVCGPRSMPGVDVARAEPWQASLGCRSDSVEGQKPNGDGPIGFVTTRIRLSRWGWVALAAVVLAIRLSAAWLGRERLDDDPDAYRTLGRIWSVTGVFGVPLEPLVNPDPSSDTQRSPNDSAARRYEWVPADGSLAVRPTAYRPPLYPAMLAALDQVDLLHRMGLGLVHAGLGLITALLLAWRLDRSHGRVAAGFAALLVACDPLLLSQATLVMTETLATALVIGGAVLWSEAWQRRSLGWGLVAGIVLGLGALCRPALLLASGGAVAMVLLWEGWTAWRVRQATAEASGDAQGRGRGWRAIAGVAIGACVTLSPWAVRNQAVFGKPLLTTTHGGYTLLLANNHAFFDAMASGEDLRAWGASSPQFQQELASADPDPVTTPRDELRQDARYRQAALTVIGSRPAEFFWAAALRVSWFWGLSPHLPDTWAMRAVSGVVGGFYLLLLMTAGAGAILHRSRDPAWWAMLAVVLVLTMVHAVYWSNLRMRAPIVPWLMWSSVLGCDGAVAFWKSRKKT